MVCSRRTERGPTYAKRIARRRHFWLEAKKSAARVERGLLSVNDDKSAKIDRASIHVRAYNPAGLLRRPRC